MTKKVKKGIIFCIHGNSSSSQVFNSILKDKTIEQEVIAIDLPGHGRNQNKFNEEDFTMEAYRNFLIEKINSLSGEILLVGNSLGGHLAIEIANEIKKLKGLIIMGTPPVKKPINFNEAWVLVPALKTFFTENPKDVDIQSAISEIIIDKGKTQILINDFNSTNPKVRMVIADDIMNNKLEDEYSLFTNLELPKYIICGKQDITVNRNYLQKCVNASKNCEIIDIDNCGHYPTDCQNKFKELIKKVCKKVF